ncbi:MAG: sterol desaturase family protein [Planctomycetota bacterium]
MLYWPWLLGISVLFVVLELLLPARPAERGWRRQFGNDLFYLAFNGHFYAVVAGGFVGAVAVTAQRWLEPWLPFAGDGSGIARWPFAAQFVVFLVVSDFLQWCVHNLLHRVPLLWQFHKVHHSVARMDWAANFRFHWIEVVVYRSLLFVPLGLLGGNVEPLFAVAVFATFYGHLNHANLKLQFGPLRYVLNGPEMHMWHHDASREGGVAKNFAIVFSAWDWLFRTAYWPRDRAPARLGYEGDAEMPPDLPRQLVFPLFRRRAAPVDQAGPVEPVRQP